MPVLCALKEACSRYGAYIASSPPLAMTLNGTYEGLHSAEWEQDHFLGVRFAQPPPQFDVWGVQDATRYGYTCMQYGTGGPWNMSEDCLTLNIIRPHESSSESLPVLVWIFGGGLGVGTTADPQYNISGIVRVGQDIGQPVIGVSINYRVASWGFLQTPEILAEGSSNAGLLDQRMALRWIKENIAAFGGDPNRVVLWGESAGAQSIAYHMMSYNGRDDGLFHGAIMESGGPTGCPLKDLSFWTAPLQNLTRTVGCLGRNHQLACLRNLSSSDLYAARRTQEWQSPLIDGDFLTAYPSKLLQERKFIKVPIITGENTNEGFTFNPSNTWNAQCPLLDTEEEIFKSFIGWRTYLTSPSTIKRLLELYPLDANASVPIYSTVCSNLKKVGAQLGRAASIGGDLTMIAGRRRMCELLTQRKVDQDVYSYRFDTRPYGRAEGEGVQHFDNVAFSFQNITGLLGPSPQYDSHRRLSLAIGEAYIRFVNNLDPNPTHERFEWQIEVQLPHWPKYSLSRPRNLVLSENGSYVEVDDYRKDAIAYINTPDISFELGA
ncbi:carboxylesterase [Dactylonectria macrodidyma]|uniref:Carboxylic ester hydrolase n=1 Tax=Dactylonectria macrodidyma TaxID=307937 RepID=A0A9P9E5N5_9HYPO|nr:carboxylesterase [Dactylonectria macrodidyma]